MRTLFTILMMAGMAQAQYLGASPGNCFKGGQNVVTQGQLSAGTLPIGTPISGPGNGSGVMASYPLATVTVYQTGTTTLANIFSNNLSVPTPLSNPFTANADGSYLFFAAGVYGPYDVVCSGGAMPSPVTFTGVDVGYIIGFDMNGNASGIHGSLTIGGPLIMSGMPWWSGTNTVTACSTIITVGTSYLCQNSDGYWYESVSGSNFYQIPLYITPGPFSSLAPCSFGGTFGHWQVVTDSNTNTWGANIAGASNNVVMAFCDGVNWTVMGK